MLSDNHLSPVTLRLAPAVMAVGVEAVLPYTTYNYLLPKPLPIIPYNESSFKRLMGQKHQLPIVQFFFGQGAGPYIIVRDYREECVVPGHFISMNEHPHYKEVTALAKDSMTLGFLQRVSAPALYAIGLDWIHLCKLKADVAGDATFSAAEDLNHLSFDIIAAAALGIPPCNGAMAQDVTKLQASGSSQVTRHGSRGENVRNTTRYACGTDGGPECQEVLREDPPSSATANQAASNMVILDHVIPKGALLVLILDGPTINHKRASVAAERRSESSRKHGGLDVWTDSTYPCEEFWYDRWLKGKGVDTEYDGAPGPFMTLGVGGGGAGNKRLAYLELRFVLALLA
ncbi:hypothetical protein VUR80DRAFT_1771 [Thermomyces stellatus]